MKAAQRERHTFPFSLFSLSLSPSLTQLALLPSFTFPHPSPPCTAERHCIRLIVSSLVPRRSGARRAPASGRKPQAESGHSSRRGGVQSDLLAPLTTAPASYFHFPHRRHEGTLRFEKNVQPKKTPLTACTVEREMCLRLREESPDKASPALLCSSCYFLSLCLPTRYNAATTPIRAHKSVSTCTRTLSFSLSLSLSLPLKEHPVRQTVLLLLLPRRHRKEKRDGYLTEAKALTTSARGFSSFRKTGYPSLPPSPPPPQHRLPPPPPIHKMETRFEPLCFEPSSQQDERHMGKETRTGPVVPFSLPHIPSCSKPRKRRGTERPLYRMYA